MNNVREMELF